MRAVVTLSGVANGNASETIQGVVHFKQETPAGGLTLRGVVSGLTPGKHGQYLPSILRNFLYEQIFTNVKCHIIKFSVYSFIFHRFIGLHVHQLGDVRDQCRSDRLGPHYNPYNVFNGSFSQEKYFFHNTVCGLMNRSIVP